MKRNEYKQYQMKKELAPQSLKGKLNGTIDVIDSSGELTVKSDLIINDLSTHEVSFGNLKALIDFKPK